MKRLLSAIIAVIAVLVGAVVATAPASARTSEIPATLNGFKFWTPTVCMAIGDTSLNAAYIAQQWNIRSSYVVKLDASNNCVTDGYTPSTRFTIDTYSAADGACVKFRNPANTGEPDASYYNGMWRWTNNPVVWVNTYYSSCAGGTQQRKAHAVSSGIGWILGLAFLNSSGYNSRVMNGTTWSWENVAYPSTYDGVLAENLYQGAYGG